MYLRALLGGLVLLLGGWMPLLARPSVEQASRFELFAALQPGVGWSSQDGIDVQQRYALGLIVPYRGAWSWETSVAFERSDARRTRGDHVDALGFDLLSRRELGAARRWRPFVGMGIHVVRVRAPASVGRDGVGASPALAVGIGAPISGRLGFRLEGRLYPLDLGSGRELESDSVVSLGFGWHF